MEKPGSLPDVTLDDIDRRIIAMLQEDGRMSTCEIARRLGNLSDRAVRYRLDRLCDPQVIYITAIVNTSRLGLPLMGDVLLEIAPWKLEPIVASLMADQRVCYIAASPDRTQVSFQVNAHDRADLVHLVAEIVDPLDGVLSMRVAPLSELIRDVKEWVVPPDQSAL